MCSAGAATGIMAVAQGGLGIGEAAAGYQQAKQTTNYNNAVAEQQYQYQQQQASAFRNFEQLKYNQQQQVMRQTRLLADSAYGDEISQINLRLMQEQEASAQQKQKAAIEGMQARGAVLASGRVGNSIDALVADYQRQQAQFDYATERNLAFTTMQMQETKRGAAATRGSRIASQQEYIKQETLDPMRPIKQAAPSATPFILQGLGATVKMGGGIYKSMNMPNTP